MTDLGADGAYRLAMHRYEARRFRRLDRTSSMGDGQGSHSFEAADDAEAITLAKALHADFYEPGTDQIAIWEVREGHADRFVHMVTGPKL